VPFARIAVRTQPPAAPAGRDDEALVAILEAPLLRGEPAAVGFARKEHELRQAFARLTILAARALRMRLATPLPGDVLADRFARLTVERRSRLLAFLGDARRRAALSLGRGER